MPEPVPEPLPEPALALLQVPVVAPDEATEVFILPLFEWQQLPEETRTSFSALKKKFDGLPRGATLESREEGTIHALEGQNVLVWKCASETKSKQYYVERTTLSPIELDCR